MKGRIFSGPSCVHGSPERLRSNQICQGYGGQNISKDERIGLFHRSCQKIRVFGSSAQSKEVETGRSYLVFDPKSILLSRSPRSGAVSYSDTARFSEHLGIFVSVSDEV